VKTPWIPFSEHAGRILSRSSGSAKGKIMNNKKLQISLFAFLTLVFVGASLTSIFGGRKAKNTPQAGAKGPKAAMTKNAPSAPVPSLGQPSDADRQAEQQRSGEIAQVRRARFHPTPESMKKLVALIDTNKDTAVEHPRGPGAARHRPATGMQTAGPKSPGQRFSLAR
jgi:hypothetical protein